MPMDYGPAWVFYHLLPMLQLQALAVVAQQHFADGIGRTDSVIVSHDQLQVDPLQRTHNYKTATKHLRFVMQNKFWKTKITHMH